MEKRNKKSLEHISDKHADMYGAKILKREEIREKVKFLLKNSSSLKDFVEKLEILGIEIDPKGQELNLSRLKSRGS